MPRLHLNSLSWPPEDSDEQPRQPRAPAPKNADTLDLKRWTTLRACACRAAVLTYRTDPLDGPQQYFSIRHGVPRLHADMAALEQYISEIGQVTA
jgi:hypothetical protein